MMKLLITLLMTTLAASAQVARYEVMQISYSTRSNPDGGFSYVDKTNSFVVKQFELAELVSASGIDGNVSGIYVTTPGGTFRAGPSMTPANPMVVLGPATIQMRGIAGYALFKITPSYYPFE